MSTITAAKIVPQQFDGSNGVVVQFDNDGDVNHLLFTYYTDELTFTASEFIGLTKEEAMTLLHKRDVAYLQAP